MKQKPLPAEVMAFAQWVSEVYDRRFTGKIELDFLNGVPQSWAPPADRVSFARSVVDKHAKLPDAVTV